MWEMNIVNSRWRLRLFCSLGSWHLCTKKLLLNTGRAVLSMFPLLDGMYCNLSQKFPVGDQKTLLLSSLWQDFRKHGCFAFASLKCIVWQNICLG